MVPPSKHSFFLFSFLETCIHFLNLKLGKRTQFPQIFVRHLFWEPKTLGTHLGLCSYFWKKPTFLTYTALFCSERPVMLLLPPALNGNPYLSPQTKQHLSHASKPQITPEGDESKLSGLSLPRPERSAALSLSLDQQHWYSLSLYMCLWVMGGSTMVLTRNPSSDFLVHSALIVQISDFFFTEVWWAMEIRVSQLIWDFLVICDLGMSIFFIIKLSCISLSPCLGGWNRMEWKWMKRIILKY